MLIEFDAEKLKEFLAADTDAEEISEGEYVVDIYEIEKPLTLNIALKKKGFEVLAAAYLEYNDELDGWVMTDRCEDETEVAAAFNALIYG